MKVDDARMPAAETAKTLSPKRPNSASGSFSEILERKLENAGERKSKEGEPFYLPDDAALPLAAVIPVDQNQVGVASEPSVQMRSEPATIQALAHEILVVAQPNGQRSVELQFNSKTLNGLCVKISQQQDQISIRFSTTSASVSDLISRNLGQLSDVLQHKGLQLAPIQVDVTPTPTNSESTNSGSRDGRSGQQNERRRQQQQQKR